MTVFHLCNWTHGVTKQKNAEKKEITKLRTTIWLLRLAAVILPANEIAEPFYWQLTRGVSRQAAGTRQQAGRQTRLCRRDAYQKMWGPSNWQCELTRFMNIVYLAYGTAYRLCRNATQFLFQFQFRSRLRARFPLQILKQKISVITIFYAPLLRSPLTLIYGC